MTQKDSNEAGEGTADQQRAAEGNKRPVLAITGYLTSVQFCVFP